MNDLTVVNKDTALEFFIEKDGIENIISQIEMEIAVFEPDLSTASSRKKIASLAAKVSKTKTYLDGVGKDLVAELKKQPKIIDSNRKLMRDRLDELRELARKPLTDWEAEQAAIAEAERIEAERAAIKQEIEQAHEIGLLLNEKIDRDLAERLAKEKQEEENRIRMEKEAQAKREEDIRKQAEKDAAREKQAAIEAAKQAEINRLAEIERSKLAAEQARKEYQEQLRLAEEKRLADIELARLAEIERQKLEAERVEVEKARLQEDKEHRRTINKQIVADLIDLGFSDDCAKQVVCCVDKGKVRNLSIDYWSK